MRLPRNGTWVANLLLILAGAVGGMGFSWVLFEMGEPDEDFVSSRSDAAIKRPSARDAALVRRVDGRPDPETHAAVSGSVGRMGARERGEWWRNRGAEAARNNLQAALAEAERIGSKQDQLDFYRGIYAVWADDDPAGALAHAQDGFPAGKLQSDAIGIAMNKWGQEHPREAWLWAEQNLAGPLKERALTDLVMGWTRRSPEEAAEWLEHTGLTSQPLFNALPGTWAETDPQAAADWVSGLPEGKARETAEVSVASTLAANDPSAAVELYAEELADGEHLNLTISLTDIWATTDPAATAEWLSGLPDGPSKDEAAATLATVWAASDISAAVAWSEKLSDPGMREQVIAHLGTTWGAIEPQAALDWLNSLPSELARYGITGAFYSWAGTDPGGLRDWIESAPEAATGDRARQSLGDVLSQSNLPDALDLAMGMSSAPARDEAVVRYFREWRKRDDASAQDWLDAHWSGLPESTQQVIRIEQDKLLYQK